ncbi:MAG: hypothetical protein GQ578_08535 [Desulfuromonadaceae bacterium]|nr:hypothetical protein [Desulfuromonadaceae bacterium]
MLEKRSYHNPLWADAELIADADKKLLFWGLRLRRLWLLLPADSCPKIDLFSFKASDEPLSIKTLADKTKTS